MPEPVRLLDRIARVRDDRAGAIITKRMTLDDYRYEQGYVAALNMVIEMAQGRAVTEERD